MQPNTTTMPIMANMLTPGSPVLPRSTRASASLRNGVQRLFYSLHQSDGCIPRLHHGLPDRNRGRAPFSPPHDGGVGYEPQYAVPNGLEGIVAAATQDDEKRVVRPSTHNVGFPERAFDGARNDLEERSGGFRTETRAKVVQLFETEPQNGKRNFDIYKGLDGL